MGRIMFHIVIACLIVLSANDIYARDSVTLGTGTPGGGFVLYGDEFARVINAVDSSLLIRPQNTNGSNENLQLLESGKLDIALVQGEAVYEAFTGKGRPPANLKIIAAMYATPGMFVVRGDSPYRTINDLKGMRVAFGAQGSGLVILARYVLDGIGLDQQKDFLPVYLDRAGDGPVMIADGRVAALWGGGTGWPGFTVVSKAQRGARFIAPDAGEISRILKKYPFLKQMTVPADSYPGQNVTITSVGSWSFILARPAFPDDVAYRIIRAMHRGETQMCNALPQACGTTVTNTVTISMRPDLIHPGIMRYLREISRDEKQKTGQPEEPPHNTDHL
ncbi:MAG: TAXI family TRAP transporter solute-binding subunit [Deltaproteobacteria bacterium]